MKMKAVKYLATLVGLMVGGGLVGALVEFYRMPAWAMLSTVVICVVICAAVFYPTNGMKRDLARIQCQLTGHWHAEFKKKYDDEAHCPRCKDLIRTKPPESDGPGMQVGEDTFARFDFLRCFRRLTWGSSSENHIKNTSMVHPCVST